MTEKNIFKPKPVARTNSEQDRKANESSLKKSDRAVRSISKRGV